jgi:histidinol dehydrogenase
MKVNTYQLETLSPEARARLLRRSETDIAALREVVEPILEEVQRRGDAALVEYSAKFDGVALDKHALRVTPDEFARAADRLDPQVREAIATSVANIRRYHEAQLPEAMWMKEIVPGVLAGEKLTPISSVGLYVPRGKGSFPSVMMMLGVPATLAGVEKVIVCTPPTPEGLVDDASLVAAQVCGLSEMYKVGGAQAIAAMTFGTESIPRVRKVLGPGNKYVSAAKRILYGLIDVGTPAGPSESIILCDEHTDPEVAAHDLLIEAEHGPDSAALLVTHSAALAEQVLPHLHRLVARLPEERKRYCEAVLSGFGGVVLTTGLDASIAFVNDYAPEHLEVLVQNPFEVLPRLNNAGEILLGPHCPITLGNFSLGVNAILPTGGFAHTFSCVSVFDFLKRSSFAYASQEGARRLIEPARRLAEFEGFPAHAEALAFRERRQA